MLKKIKKIRTKVLLPTLVILFVAMIVTSSISAYLSYRSTLTTLEQTMTETITAASGRVTAELNGYKELLIELAGVVPGVEPTKVMSFLETSKARHGFTEMSITLPNGVIGGTDIDISSQDFFKVPRDTGRPYVSAPVMNLDGVSMTYYVSAPVMTNGTRFDGIIFVGMDAQELCKIVADVSVGESGNAAIIDKNGTTIAFYDYPTVLGAYNTQKEENTDPQLAKLAALEREVMAGNSGFGDYSYGGAAKFMAYAPVADTDGWGMYVTVAQGEFMAGTYNAILISIVAVAVFLILATLMLIALVASITRPIVQIEEGAMEMAKGNFDVTITHQSNDEIGGLADSMRRMITTTKDVILDTSRGLGEIANGNFNIAPKAEYIGVFSDIKDAIGRIITDLSDTMSQIKMATEQVSSGSEQVSSGAQALAQGATEQASSVQELSASINEVSTQIKGNAANAAEASHLADSVGSDINVSNNQMTQMVGAMGEIS
ncbi:MAG: methyl-accepting chemotaxis protein, partial [Angelakisella sp.]